jgi:putative nucleotidyltransferase with HDIG domain
VRHVAGIKQNLRRLLLTFDALSDLGPALTAERDFTEVAPSMLSSLMDALDAREGVLFRFTDKPAMLSSVAARGYVSFPQPAVIPLLPKHVHSLSRAPGPRILDAAGWEEYFTSNGNLAPELLRCVAPLRVGGKLVGVLGLGQRNSGSQYDAEDLEGLALMSHYLALGMHNHSLTETLSQRLSENLKLMATIHNFYDSTLEAFAAAIDFKHVNIHGHSLRVGRYASGIAEALGLTPNDVAGLRAAGYLHDIGKVSVDKYLFAKPGALDAREFQEMAEHTTAGFQIVNGVHFPWPKVPEVVRWHHERLDGSGYPDHLHADSLDRDVRIMGVADSFDAMTSERPYRHSMTVGEALIEIVKLTPHRFDPNAVQALLIQIRRDAVSGIGTMLNGKMVMAAANDKPRFLDTHTKFDLMPTDIDQMAGMLNHKLTNGRVYSA